MIRCAGHTSKKIVRRVREEAPKKIHLRISCPPTISPCYYGTILPTRMLIAAQWQSKRSGQFYRGRLAGLSFLEGMIEATGPN